MEIERKKEEKKKKDRQRSEKRTPFNISEEKSIKAAESRESNPALMALYNSFFPGIYEQGRPKFITDKYGNRVRNKVETKEKMVQ